MSLITSLFCPLCQDPYDDTNKRPRLGSCRHSVCDLCIATRVQCPICNEKNAFSEVLYNFELCKMLDAFNENVTEENFQRISNNPKNLNLGACSACLTTERLRVCVTCAGASHLFKKLPNGKFQVLNHNRALQLTKFVYFCSDCIADGQPDHAEHQFLPPSKIDAMKIDLNYWQYIIHAKLLEKKMYDEENKEVQDKTQLFNRILLEFRRQALSYEVAMKSSQFEKLEDQFKLTRIKQVDIFSIPELADAKRKSFEEAQKVISRLLKLQERKLWYQRDKIKLEIRNMSYHESMDPIVLKFREELSNLSLRFESFRITELSQAEADQLDKNANSKLEEAMQKLPLYNLDKKFHVYKALCNILKDSDEKRKRVTEMIMKEWTSFEEFFESRIKKIGKTPDPLAQRLFRFELTEKSFKMDKLRIEHLESVCDWLEGELIWEQWYPNHRDADSEDSYYNILLSEKFLNDGKCFVDRKFESTLISQ
ncbi:unnamed protein product [Caenorhabditis brenneri]